MRYEPRLSGFLKFQIPGIVGHGRLIFATRGQCQQYHQQKLPRSSIRVSLCRCLPANSNGARIGIRLMLQYELS
jgi:hypothetical protein